MWQLLSIMGSNLKGSNRRTYHLLFLTFLRNEKYIIIKVIIKIIYFCNTSSEK